MKKILIIILFFISSVSIGISQTTYSRVYDMENGNEFGMEIRHYNGNIYIYGKGINYDSNKYSHGHEYLSVIDSVTLKMKKIFFFREYYFSNLGHVMEFVDDTIYTLGRDSYLPYKWNVYKFSMNVDSLGIKVYGPFDKEKTRAKALVYQNGYFYISGVTYKRNANLEFLKTDKKGKIVKQSKLEEFAIPEEHNFYGDFIKTADGNFIVNSGYNNEAQYHQTYSSNLCKIDTGFNIIWQKIMYRGASGTMFGNYTAKLEPSLDSGFYASVIVPFADSMFAKKFADRRIADWPVLIYKYDKDGSVEWSDTMFNFRYEDWTHPRRKIEHLKTLKNGDLLGCGYIEEPVYKPVTSYRGWLFRYSKEGKLKWQHYYQYNGQDTTKINDVVECGNGDLLCVGEIKWKNESDLRNKYRTWLLRVDSNGCYIPGCNLDTLTAIFTSLAEVECPAVINVLNLYPNPVSDILNVEIPENYARKEKISWEIYDMNGKLIKKGIQAYGFEDLVITGLSGFDFGIYYLVLKSKKQLIGVGKFMKQ